MDIKRFRDEHRWLSNFAPVAITLQDRTYPSVEHAYMSAKNNSADWKRFCADSGNSPGQVKRRSRTITICANWHEIKLEIMQQCLLQKFSQEPYRTKLLMTGNAYIEEGNTWGDTFWGVCNGKGENNLGKLIMQIRADLQKKS